MQPNPAASIGMYYSKQEDLRVDHTKLCNLLDYLVIANSAVICGACRSTYLCAQYRFRVFIAIGLS